MYGVSDYFCILFHRIDYDSKTSTENVITVPITVIVQRYLRGTCSVFLKNDRLEI